MNLKILAVATFSAFCLAQPAAAENLPTVFANEAGAACQAPADLYLLHDGQRVVMRSITAQSRTAARAMGFGGVAQFAVLGGSSAMYRLPTTQPTFLLSAPGNVQPQGLFTLARFEPRQNGTREVLVGGGFMSYSTGVIAERQVALNVRLAADQSGAASGTTLYELTPQAPLAPGEYALIVAIGPQGAATPMGGPQGTFYDFGVD
jgi:hypothetical protein